MKKFSDLTEEEKKTLMFSIQKIMDSIDASMVEIMNNEKISQHTKIVVEWYVPFLKAFLLVSLFTPRDNKGKEVQK